MIFSRLSHTKDEVINMKKHETGPRDSKEELLELDDFLDVEIGVVPLENRVLDSLDDPNRKAEKEAEKLIRNYEKNGIKTI